VATRHSQKTQGCPHQFVDHLQIGLRLGVSKAVAASCRTRALIAVRSAKLLGVGSAGGRKRCTKFSKVRISAFRKGIPRIQMLRRARVNAVLLTRAAGTPMITYGVDAVGIMAGSQLDAAMRSIAKALAPEAGGNSAQLVLYAADGARGTLDLAFDAHVLPLQMWAIAHWQLWEITHGAAADGHAACPCK